MNLVAKLGVLFLGTMLGSGRSRAARAGTTRAQPAIKAESMLMAILTEVEDKQTEAQS